MKNLKNKFFHKDTANEIFNAVYCKKVCVGAVSTNAISRAGKWKMQIAERFSKGFGGLKDNRLWDVLFIYALCSGILLD